MIQRQCFRYQSEWNGLVTRYFLVNYYGRYFLVNYYGVKLIWIPKHTVILEN